MLGSGSSIRQYARLDSRIDFIPLKTEAGDTTCTRTYLACTTIVYWLVRV